MFPNTAVTTTSYFPPCGIIQTYSYSSPSGFLNRHCFHPYSLPTKTHPLFSNDSLVAQVIQHPENIRNFHPPFLKQFASGSLHFSTMTSKLVPPRPEDVMVIRKVQSDIITLNVPFYRFGYARIGGRCTIGTNHLEIDNGCCNIAQPVC